MLLIRSQFYNLLMYILIVVIGVLFFIPALISRKGAYAGLRTYCKINKPMLRWICNIRQEIRGPIPDEPCVVCAKHMSFLDIVMLADALPEFKFVMKEQIKYIPFLGFYAMRIGSAPVKRGAGSQAVEKMVDDLNDEAQSGQIVIYPQGTRVLPGQVLPYKRGAAALYKSFELPCYMAATNIGVLWARKSPYRYPGVAVIEFLDERIPVGMDSKDFMDIISTKIETRSNELMEEYPAYYKG